MPVGEKGIKRKGKGGRKGPLGLEYVTEKGREWGQKDMVMETGRQEKGRAKKRGERTGHGRTRTRGGHRERGDKRGRKRGGKDKGKGERSAGRRGQRDWWTGT